MKLVYSNAPSLLPVLPFRLSSLLWAYPTPSSAGGLTATLGYPTFMRYLRDARNIIILRVLDGLQITVNSTIIAGFTGLGRLTNTPLI